jgi:hypothetical protein
MSVGVSGRGMRVGGGGRHGVPDERPVAGFVMGLSLGRALGVRGMV